MKHLSCPSALDKSRLVGLPPSYRSVVLVILLLFARPGLSSPYTDERTRETAGLSFLALARGQEQLAPDSETNRVAGGSTAHRAGIWGASPTSHQGARPGNRQQITKPLGRVDLTALGLGRGFKTRISFISRGSAWRCTYNEENRWRYGDASWGPIGDLCFVGLKEPEKTSGSREKPALSVPRLRPMLALPPPLWDKEAVKSRWLWRQSVNEFSTAQKAVNQQRGPSKLFRAMGWGLYGACAGDAISTEIALSRGAYEANPFMRNRPLRISYHIAVPILINYATERARKEGHEKVGLWMRIAFVAVYSVVTVHNLRQP